MAVVTLTMLIVVLVYLVIALSIMISRNIGTSKEIRVTIGYICITLLCTAILHYECYTKDNRIFKEEIKLEIEVKEAEQPSEIIQIAGGSYYIYILCKDNSVWYRTVDGTKWNKINDAQKGSSYK